MNMLIKDLVSGSVREYGKNCHDSLIICRDGKTLSYYNLQNGEGSRYGDYRFVMEDGEVPCSSRTPEAMNVECYFNIGGFPDEEAIRADERTKVNDSVNAIIQYIKNNSILCDIEEHSFKMIGSKLVINLLEQIKEQSNE